MSDSDRIPPLNLTADEGDYLWGMITREIGKKSVWEGDETETVQSLHTKIGEMTDSFDTDSDRSGRSP